MSSGLEAEVLAILEPGPAPDRRVKLNSLLAAMGRQAQLTAEEFAAFDQGRSDTPDSR